MMFLRRLAFFVSLCAALSACTSQQSNTGELPGVASGSGESPKTLTPNQCAKLGGIIVGDIGDGRIHRPDYRCSNGDKPKGRISFEDEKIQPVEGAVCCAQ